MLTRPLALKLLAPMVLVSLALVAACIAGAMTLNNLNVNLSKEFDENIESTRAAQELETAADELVRILREDDVAKTDFASRVDVLNADAEASLARAVALANLPEEKRLVAEVRTGLAEYLQQWASRPRLPGDLKDYDKRLARQLDGKVLSPCKKLRNYNLEQIGNSNQTNQEIVKRLTWGLLAVGLGAPLSGLLLGYAVARSLHHSIYQLSVGIRDAAGRLNRELGSVTVQEEGDLPSLHRQMQTVVTEIERVVSQLQQREREVLRAEQLAAVGQVAAGVAHELRNPLTSVKMLVQTGLEDCRSEGLLADELHIIEHEIRRMEQCIQMFLDFARPPHSERRQADLAQVLKLALALVEGRARRQNVALVSELPSEPVQLEIDPEQIRQVLVNLLLNALDALPRGGEVRVAMAAELESGQIGNEKPGALAPSGGESSRIRVQVRDTGLGIPPRILERLFEPFVSSKETGMGLGLSISKRLIEAHGGGIEGRNAPEGGAIFTFTLPCYDSLK